MHSAPYLEFHFTKFQLPSLKNDPKNNIKNKIFWEWQYSHNFYYSYIVIIVLFYF